MAKNFDPCCLDLILTRLTRKAEEKHEIVMSKPVKLPAKYKRIPIFSYMDHEEPDGIVYTGGSYLHGRLEEDAHYDLYFILEKDLPTGIPLTKWCHGSRMSGFTDHWEVDPGCRMDDDTIKTFAFDECVLKMEFKGKPCVGYYWTEHLPIYDGSTKEYLGENYNIRGLVVYEDDEEARQDAERKMKERRTRL